MFSITTSSTAVNAIIFFALGITLYSSWRKEKKGEELKFFSIALTAFGMQQLFFAIGTVFGTNNPTASTWFWATAHLFMFIGISYLLRFAMRIRSMRREGQFFKFVIALSIVGELILIISRPSVQPFYLPQNNIFNWTVPALPGATIGIVTLITLAITFWIFVSNIGRITSKILKFRSLAFALGILLFLVGGPMHNFVTTPALNFIADATLDLGVIVMAVSVYIPRFFAGKSQSVPVTQTESKQTN